MLAVFLTCVPSAILISLGLSGNVYYTKRRHDAQKCQSKKIEGQIEKLDRQVKHSHDRADAQESLSKKIEGQVEKANSQLEHLHDHVERRERERQDAALEKRIYGDGGEAGFVEKLYGKGGRAAYNWGLRKK